MSCSALTTARQSVAWCSSMLPRALPVGEAPWPCRPTRRQRKRPASSAACGGSHAGLLKHILYE